LTRAWTLPDEVTRSIPASKADRAVALVFKLARVKVGVHAQGSGGEVRGGRCDRLNAGLLVIGDDRHRRRAGFLFSLRRRGRRLLQDVHLAGRTHSTLAPSWPLELRVHGVSR